METAAEAPAPKGNGKAQARVLVDERFGVAEAKRNDWVADVEIGTTREDIMEPSFWAHVAPRMSPYDHIEVRADDGTWIAFLIVLYAERNYARVVLDRYLTVELNAEVPASSMKYKVEWKGPHYRFSVIRLSDSSRIHDGCKTRDEAYAWMKAHEKSMS